MAALIKIIKDQSIFNAEEHLYIGNSKLLIQVLKKLELEFLYEPILHHGRLNSTAKSFVDGKRLSEVQALKLAYCYGKTKDATNDYTALVEEIVNKKISARELVIYPFATQHKPQETETKPLEESPDPKEFRSSLLTLERDAYLSTPRFMRYLTDLSSELMAAEKKIIVLRKELRKLNKSLPSNVYIPFVNNQIRNSIILCIPPKEAKIFITKEKVPYLIAVEVFDPLEIAFNPENLLLSSSLYSKRLPAPGLPLRFSSKHYQESKKQEQEEIIAKRINDALNLYTKTKTKHKKGEDNLPITINAAKMQKTINSKFMFN